MSNNTGRRIFLTSAAAFLGVSIVVQLSPVRASSKSNRAGFEFSKRMNAVKYSQAEFLKLSRNKLVHLHNYKIDGFVDWMATKIVHMMLDDRASTRQLMQDMAKLETGDARNARLVVEIRHATALQQTHENSLNRKTADGRRQLKRAKRYRKSVGTWHKYPSEGSLFNSCSFEIGNIVLGCTPSS